MAGATGAMVGDHFQGKLVHDLQERRGEIL